MADRKRRGMLIKNNGSDAVTVRLETRTLTIAPGATVPLAPAEVRDGAMRTALQTRTIAIVRPATPTEEAAARQAIDEAAEG
ncbi:hypothetical protein [Salisaeta longa]|uniref:hypothetical protein n=1 Tax=Salisaeta longa TaxID=503170 RepID=UPI0003B65610|nr:hypothetical protein [Salisaeta longa]